MKHPEPAAAGEKKGSCQRSGGQLWAVGVGGLNPQLSLIADVFWIFTYWTQQLTTDLVAIIMDFVHLRGRSPVHCFQDIQQEF